jgi:dTDP-4-dehydrorhamnose reductase
MIVLGSGFVAREFSKWGYPTISRKEFEWNAQFPQYYKLKCLLEPYTHVVNTIAASDTKRCQNDPAYAMDLNIDFIKFLNDICRVLGIQLIHISTGCVYEPCPYSGVYSETDPLSTYTLTKALGECLIDSHNIILRPRLIFGPERHKNNLFDKIKNYTKFLTEPQSITSTTTIVEATKTLIDQRASGIFNVVQTDYLSITEIANIMGLKVEGDLLKNELREKSSLTSPEIQLSSDKLHEYYIPRTASDEVRQCFTQWHSVVKEAPFSESNEKK